MRLMEGMRLRIKDVDFDRHVIIVRDAKGGKDRVVMLPSSREPALRAQWEADRQAQRGGIETPHALKQKYLKVGYTSGWFWTFPSARCRLTRAVVWNADTTCTKTGFSVHSKRPCHWREFANRSRFTRCVTRSPRIYCKPVPTSERYKSCLDTATFRPP